MSTPVRSRSSTNGRFADRYLNPETNTTAQGYNISQMPHAVGADPTQFYHHSEADHQQGFHTLPPYRTVPYGVTPPNYIHGYHDVGNMSTILASAYLALAEIQNSFNEIKDGKGKVLQRSTSRESPPGLSACVRKVHASFDEENPYQDSERVNSKHNLNVTEKIVAQVMLIGKEYSSKSSIEYVAKKFHEYLVRKQKPISEEERNAAAKPNRIVQRRQRLFERRLRFANVKQARILRSLSEKYMTDEETDDEDGFLITRSSRWRHKKLTELFTKLDKKYKKFSKSKKSRPLKPRKPGPFSERKPPSNVPHWAAIDGVHETSESTTESQEAPETESPSTSDGDVEFGTTDPMNNYCDTSTLNSTNSLQPSVSSSEN